MRRLLIFLVLTLSTITALAESVVVNCDAGHSLNRAISKLNKHEPNTVLVEGTCTEFVTIAGFENLTVKSTSGATLVQPSVLPTNSIIYINLLRINSSRSVTIDGLNLISDASKLPNAIGIDGGSSNVRLRNLSVMGGSAGILVFENSQVSIARVTVKNAGWAYVAAVDQSEVDLEDCVLQESTGTGWHIGIFVSGAGLRVFKTTIQDMQVGIHSGYGGSITVENFSAYSPIVSGGDVVINNPSGSNFYGALVDDSSTLYVQGTTKLQILNAGQPWGGDTGGVKITGSSSLDANANLIISGSHGQGIYVTGNSHAKLDGSSVTGSQHGGLVAVNLGTISQNPYDVPTTVSGNAVDLFCDSNSVITGGVKIANATTIQCPNLLQWDSVPVP